MTQTNAFGQVIPSMEEILTVPNVRDYVVGTLNSVLGALGIDNPDKIIGDVLACACKPLGEYEASAHELLDARGVTQGIPERLSGRAETIFQQIRPYLPTKGKILDYGCGDGKVGERIAQDPRFSDCKVTLTDVYRHNHIRETGLDFRLMKDPRWVPSDVNEFDVALLLTVLHHADDLLQVLSQTGYAVKPGGRIIVIESSYGVDGTTHEYGAFQDKSGLKIARAFKQLDVEEQRLANIFFDHFYNRVVHYSEDPNGKVNVPLNFMTPEQLERILVGDYSLKRDGITCHFPNLAESQLRLNLGIDQSLVPEYHVLDVVDVHK